METLIMIRGFLGLGIPKSRFTEMVTALNGKDTYYDIRTRWNVLKEIHCYWPIFNSKQANEISNNLAELVEKGRFVKNTDYNKVLEWLISKSKLIANSMIDTSFKNKELPNPRAYGHAIYAFVIMPIILCWPKLVEEKVRNGELPNEWLTLGKK